MHRDPPCLADRWRDVPGRVAMQPSTP